MVNTRNIVSGGLKIRWHFVSISIEPEKSDPLFDCRCTMYDLFPIECMRILGRSPSRKFTLIGNLTERKETVLPILSLFYFFTFICSSTVNINIWKNKIIGNIEFYSPFFCRSVVFALFYIIFIIFSLILFYSRTFCSEIGLTFLHISFSTAVVLYAVALTT